MNVGLHFLAGLSYLYFAGFGFTRLVLKNHGHRDYFILLNGFCLSIVIFSVSILFAGSAQHALELTVAACALLNAAYLISQRRSIHLTFRRRPASQHQRRLLYTRLSLVLIATGVVVFVAWSFFYAGWHTFWGSANEDIFDGLYGRDAYLSAHLPAVSPYLDPLTRYQYSSLAFWSILFRAFGSMNVFYLQGLLMIFLQVVGIYFLCRVGFRFAHSLALLSAFLGSCGSFFISTLFTGHEGSLMFAAFIPFLLGFAMDALRREKLSLRPMLALALWLYFISQTYIFPLGFTLVPFLLTVAYFLVGRKDGLLGLAKRWHLSPPATTTRISVPVKVLILIAVTLILAAGLYVLADRAWFLVEPLRSRAKATYRAWGIAHFKEMILIYWGFLPSSIPFGSIPNPAKLGIPAILAVGYLASSCLVLSILYGIRRSIIESTKTGVFFLLFALCWFVMFLFMKYFVVDSYYLYKFYYTNYFMGAIILAYGGDALYRKVHFPSSENLEKGKRVAVILVAAGFVVSNLVYIALYNVDVSSRSYNKRGSQVIDVSPLDAYSSKGVFFNLPQFDLQNLLEYLFHARGYPLPNAISRFFEYELEVKGVDDILLREPPHRLLVWENETFRLYRANEHDKLIVETYYQGERYPDIYDDHPFRWVRDNVTLEVIDPSPTGHSLSFCVEPGPGLDYHPFWLSVYANDRFVDSVLVRGLQSVTVPLPELKQKVNVLKVVNREKGRNFLPWEERFLNYRMSLIGISDQEFSPQALRILNSSKDIVPDSTWPVLQLEPSLLGRSDNILCIGNNWWPAEFHDGQRMRWATNDVEFVLLNPTAAARYLHLVLERGPGLGQEKTSFSVLVNGTAIDSLDLKGLCELKVQLPKTLLKENIITLHVNRQGKAVGADPRILNFRVFRASLGEE